MQNLVTLFLITSFLAGLWVPVSASGSHDHAHETEEHSPQHSEEGHNPGGENTHHGDEHHHDGHDHHRETHSSRIEDDMAEQVGIVTAIADSRVLHRTITVYGSIVSAPEQLSHVRARFEGMVKSVKVSLGDRVKTGDVLAEIESNDSLKIYSIRAPIPGRIVQRHANTGEVTRNQTLFSIANLDTVWAEFRVFPEQISLVAEGQTVSVTVANEPVSSKIDHILPSMDFPYQLARVKLNNSERTLSPGLTVEAHIEVERVHAALTVAKEAVQTLEGRQGVFVKKGAEYQFTPVVLGCSDDYFYQVVEGLTAGEEYVAENSYLIKADIEKSQAEHVH